MMRQQKEEGRTAGWIDKCPSDTVNPVNLVPGHWKIQRMRTRGAISGAIISRQDRC